MRRTFLSLPALARRDAALVAGGIVALATLVACSKDKPKPSDTGGRPSGTVITPFEPGPSPYHVVSPDEVEPLEVLRFEEPVGPGYAKVPVDVGPSIHSGKWLGLAQGRARFLGPKHIVVNHYPRRPRDRYLAEPSKSVLIDVEAGEAVLEFEHGRRAQWHFGFALVYKHDDDTPYLLNVESPELVPVLPAGDHEYVFGTNYWIRFSPIARRVWIIAVDAEETPHLYEWEELGKPPPAPNNPAPFVPESWDPSPEWQHSTADTEEIQPENTDPECDQVILVPPRGFECVTADDEFPRETEALSGGWRVDPRGGFVFKRGTREGFDLTELCADPDAVFASVEERSPPIARIRCQGEPRVWALWDPRFGVRKMDPDLAELVNTAKLGVIVYGETGQVELTGEDEIPSHFWTWTDETRGVLELISKSFKCADIGLRHGNRDNIAHGCASSDGSFEWFELVNTKTKVRGRVNASDLAIGQTGLAIAVVRRGGRDHLVRAKLRAP